MNAIDFCTIRAARQLMTDEEARLAFEIAAEAERANGAAEVVFWELIRAVLADPERRLAAKGKTDNAAR